MMPDPSLLPERIFGLSAVDGRRSVRPGEIISFQFRAKNGGETATPGALLVLVLPPGWSPLDPLEAEVPPIAPGAEHTLTFRARPDVADATTALSPVQAALHIDTLVLGSNVVRMQVFGRPRLDGPASSVRVEAAGGDALRVRAVVVNEGDAAARSVRIVVPPPPGFVAEESAIVTTCAELAVGATASFSYLMTPLEPGSAIAGIDDAYVAFHGGRVALTTSAGALLAPNLVPPQIEAERRAGRLDLRIRVANDGWVPARDVRCALELPPGWRILRGTLRADDAPAIVRRDGESDNGVVVALPLVPARGGVDVSVVASASRPGIDGGAAVVHCGAHTASLAIPRPAERALRLDARPEFAFGEPGTSVAVAVDVHNNGETHERVTVALDGHAAWSGELRPGAAAAFVTRYAVPADAADGDLLTVGARATGDDGTALATARFSLRALDRPWIAIESVVWEGEQTRVTIRNVGATAARDIRIDGETEALVPLLAPGQTASVIVPPAVARTAALVGSDERRVPIGWDDQLRPVALRAALIAPARVRSGERLDVRLQCVAAEGVQSIRIRPRPHPAATYVAGSSSVNGHAVVDGVDGPPLMSAGGLALHDVPAGTVVEVAWSVLARTPGETIVAVDLSANGAAVEVAPLTIAIADAPPFGVRPNALPFHIDAPTVGEFSVAAHSAAEPAVLAPAGPTSVDALPAAPEPSAPEAFALAAPDMPVDETRALPSVAAGVTTWLALDAARVAAIVRVLRGARGSGLVSHIPSLAALFPAGIVSGDPELDARFGGAADAIRGVYERLFVKLRIPGYDVAATDWEDGAGRAELLGLLEAVAGATVPAQPCADPGDVHGRLDPQRARTLRAELAGAPLGDPRALAAVAMLLPRHGRGDAAAAVGAYAGALSAAFEAANALTPRDFVSYAVNEPCPDLDAARRVAIAVLDARNELASS